MCVDGGVCWPGHRQMDQVSLSGQDSSWDSRFHAESTCIHQQPLLGDSMVTLNGSIYKIE